MKTTLLICLLFPVLGYAAEETITLRIKNHRFSPSEITVPAGKKVKLLVENQDATPEEFDSHALNREKTIAGNSSSSIYIGPLTAGRYPFAGEFHADTAQGIVIAQ